MKTFKDRRNREWTIEMTIAAAKRVRTLCGVDILELGEATGDFRKSLTYRLMSDPVLLGDVLFAVVKPQADALRITSEDFGEALAGEPVDAAMEALLAEIVFFTPNPLERARKAKALAKVTALMEATRKALDRTMDDPATEAKFQEALSILGSGSSSLPAKSESTPPPSPSAS